MERIALAPGVNLTAVRDERFKTGAYSLNLLTPLEKETASQRAVLPYVLRRGTARYPEAEELEAALDELYGARLEPFVRKKGEVQAIGFYADFADPAFVDEAQMPEKMAALLGEVLLNPAMQSGNLRRERVALERENLLADIRAGINDKGSYADERLLALMCRGENYSVPKLGSLPQAKRIGHLTLTRAYRELLRTAPIELFACTAWPTERIVHAFQSAFSTLPPARGRVEPETRILFEPPAAPRLFREACDARETQVRVGYRLGDQMRAPDQAALLVLNALIGGASTSRLYRILREERGLCYHTGSQLDRYKGVLLLSAAVEAEKAEEALEAMESEVEAIRAGAFEDWELDAASASVAGMLTACGDSQTGLEGYALAAHLLNVRLLPEELSALARTVTRQQVLFAAEGLRQDTAYILRGEAQDA